ncbi:MAG: hypothetical protein ACLPTZ_07335 [Beijerinckiaceae bacterium]
MSRRKQKNKDRLPPFVALLKDTLKSAAWRAMSHGARSLYVGLKLRYSSNFKNNGQIYLSVRDAAEEVGSGQEEICSWYKELQFYGFIVMTQPGRLGVEGKGLAPHWRLTELGYMTEPATRDFLKWDGINKFRRRKRASRRLKAEPRSGNAEHPATEMLSTSAPEMLSTFATKRSGNAEHTAGHDRSGNAEHN